MKLYQRACMVVAQEGISGLCRRVARKCFPDRHEAERKAREEEQQRAEAARMAAEMDADRQRYPRLVAEFNARAKELGHGDLSHYYWYHTIDLGDGLVTPGDYDYRDALPLYKFPADMRGMNVLDVGSATGFFAFEFERRGAKVVSVDLPSMTEWDIANTDREKELQGLTQWHHSASEQETYHSHLDGPFLFCKKLLKSNVKRCYSRIYDLTPEKVGVGSFDLIFLGDVLGHLFSPLKALDVLAPLCRGKMVLSQDLVKAHTHKPLLWYIGGDAGLSYNRSWWIPNQICLEQMLKRVGFKHVEVVGHHYPIIRRHWERGDRFLIHATK